ncbi:hypothetical protein OG730_26220 [Streptomyces sp. NBC_01298]|uniref:hypothetical protein n=1 Tax=Streptomyces sp. NBC_01298 TaxID=2903817 RepID=UPI002E140F8A|nr:hypothetical protein OG730_26220 [Streptomyces sp. NBC_01298]
MAVRFIRRTPWRRSSSASLNTNPPRAAAGPAGDAVDDCDDCDDCDAFDEEVDEGSASSVVVVLP